MLIYLLGSPIFWLLFILAVAVVALITCFCRKSHCDEPKSCCGKPKSCCGKNTHPCDPPCFDNRPDNTQCDNACNVPDNAHRSPAAAPLGVDELNTLLHAVGYAYDVRENAFYAPLDAWQRRYGYCALYDEAITPSGMVADCEPVYFTHGGTRYLIELWKGQYGLTTGCEVGVYRHSGKKLLGSDWYEAVPDDAMPDISVELYKTAQSSESGTPQRDLRRKPRREPRGYLNLAAQSVSQCETLTQRLLFRRHERHWWLTGFVLGEFSQPSELSMTVEIMLPDAAMRHAFLMALRDLGYTCEEAYAYGSAVIILYSQPKSRQPVTRTKILEKITQRRNRLACERFARVVGGEANALAILALLRTEHPELYASALDVGRKATVFTRYAKDIPT